RHRHAAWLAVTGLPFDSISLSHPESEWIEPVKARPGIAWHAGVRWPDRLHPERFRHWLVWWLDLRSVLAMLWRLRRCLTTPVKLGSAAPPTGPVFAAPHPVPLTLQSAPAWRAARPATILRRSRSTQLSFAEDQSHLPTDLQTP